MWWNHSLVLNWFQLFVRLGELDNYLPRLIHFKWKMYQNLYRPTLEFIIIDWWICGKLLSIDFKLYLIPTFTNPTYVFMLSFWRYHKMLSSGCDLKAIYFMMNYFLPLCFFFLSVLVNNQKLLWVNIAMISYKVESINGVILVQSFRYLDTFFFGKIIIR